MLKYTSENKAKKKKKKKKKKNKQKTTTTTTKKKKKKNTQVRFWCTHTLKRLIEIVEVFLIEIVEVFLFFYSKRKLAFSISAST